VRLAYFPAVPGRLLRVLTVVGAVVAVAAMVVTLFFPWWR